MKKLFQQIIKFGFVGFLCFFVDYGILVFLYRLAGFDPLAASGISFTVSVTINYILSITIVFETDKSKSKVKEFLVFVFFSVIGLGINQVCMWLGIHALHQMPELVKIGATAVVMVYNFISRKLFIEKKE